MSDATSPARSIPFIDLDAQRLALDGRDRRAIERVLAHGKFILGPEVAELERILAARTGSGHVVTCASGTDALLLVLMAWGVGPGDAVFVPAFSFTATAEVVALLGATPVFCDVDRESFNLDLESFIAALEQVRRSADLRPRAVIPVDLYGQPARYPELTEAAEAAGVVVLADAAQSFGATLGRRPVGSLAAATATSFFPAKPLGCYGDGGAVFTDDAELAAAMRSLRVHGQGSTKYDTVRIGLNARLDTIQAAVLLAKLTVFDEELRLRSLVARRYSDALSSYVPVPRLDTDATSSWAQYTVLLRHRDQVAAELAKRGIATAVYYPRPLHRQPAFGGALKSPTGCGVADELSAQVLSLPMHPYLDEMVQDQIIEAFIAALTG